MATLEFKVPDDLSDNDKLRELVLYIAERSESDMKFGATKLNKLLFYADFLFYLYHGHSITGQNYQKLEHGPAPRAIVPTIQALEKACDAKTVERMHYGKTQKRLIALRSARLSGFSADEIAFVDRLLDDFRDKSASEVSDLSHKFAGWKLAKLNETIPYEVALIGRRHPTRKDIEHGLSLEGTARDILARGN